MNKAFKLIFAIAKIMYTMAAGNGKEIRISVQWQQMGALLHVAISETESFLQWQLEKPVARGNSKEVIISVQW